MKQFILKSKLFILISLSICTGIFLAIPLEKDHFLAELRVKKELLRSTSSPKMVFVSGSNLLFGFDSEKIAKKFKTNVVNYGFTLNLGIRNLADQIYPYLHSGDTFVLVLEYQHYGAGFYASDSPDLWYLIAYDPEILKYFTAPQQILHLARSFPESIKFKIKYALSGKDASAHRLEKFNTYGDYLDYGDTPKREIGIPDWNVKNIPESFAYLVNLQKKLNEKNVTMKITFPPITKEAYEKNKLEIDTIYKKLLESKLPVCGTPESYIYPASGFYDDVYHLNTSMKEKRTNDIIKYCLDNI
jgi:hypothetical protein